MADDFASGDLVRYLETKNRWFFARVRRVRESEIELSFFDDHPPLLVPRDSVESMQDFLGVRERTWSRTRAQLTSFFYGREFERLSAERVREIRRALRSAGVQFSPDQWLTSETRVQLSLDSSFVAPTEKTSELERLLPQWIEPFTLPPGSRDPLGLQAPAERLVNDVLPGLTVFTFRAGYYGFLTWAIRTANGMTASQLGKHRSRRDLLNAFERALALCEFVYHGHEDDSGCVLIGQRSKTRVLAAHSGDKYRVPESILKNQNSAGAFRLFSTSLVSLGLAEESPELAAAGLLPFRLTSLGDDLSRQFASCVDSAFIPFARGDGAQSRNAIRAWGKRLCFSNIAKKSSYRRLLLRGLLFGNSRDAEMRSQTLAHLFDAGLLPPVEDAQSADGEENEEDAAAAEEAPQGTGVSNLDVVLRFYQPEHASASQALQTMALFELLSLGLSAIFRAAIASVAEPGRSRIAGLSQNLCGQAMLGDLAFEPISRATVPTVFDSAKAIVATEAPNERAGAGLLLVLRLLGDPLLDRARGSLVSADRELVELIDRVLTSRRHRPLTELLPDLLVALVERHALVSQRKNRQRWIFIEGEDLVRDDIQAMGLGLHALRFPQLGSLVRDLDLKAEHLDHV